MELRILGPLEAVEGDRVVEMRGRKQRELLGFLAVHANHVVPSDRIIDALWGESPPPTALKTLQAYISRLRKALGQPGSLTTHGRGYSLALTQQELDVTQFAMLLDEGRRELAAGHSDRAAETLDSALGLWRGAALADFAYTAWAQTEIARLEGLRVAAREERVEANLARGRYAEVISELEALIADDPLRERPRAQLMLALYRSGRQAEALQTFQEGRRLLSEELGLEPSQSLQQLERQILGHDPTLGLRAATPSPAPRRTAPPEAPGKTNLPTPSTPFLGREKELREIASLLARRDIRLLTLTGPGGTGKTRLALRSAASLADSFSDGVWWVPLETLRDPTLVVESAARAVGAEHELPNHVGEKQMLIVFDCAEQVVDAAPRLADLLAACSNLKLLVTSRERLKLTMEQEYPVPPFAHDEAVEFFTARARSVQPDFVQNALVSGICDRLDDLPLALELAAARVKSLSSQEIHERLNQRLPLLSGGARDLPDRQRSLRATIDWSYELLDDEEQKLFRGLSIFAGGCTLQAVEAVLGADLDVLQSLVDKSLVRRTDKRYFMLDTIHEYARGRLERGEADALQAQHADYFVAFAEALGGRNLFEGDQPAAVEQLAHEMDNVRAAIEWSLDTHRYGNVLRFGAALWLFWGLRGHSPEGRRWLDAAVTLGRRDTEEWLWGAIALGEIERDVGSPERARALKEETLPLLRKLGDTRGVAAALADLGDLAMDDGDYELAHRLLDESLSLRSPEFPGGMGRTLSSLGELALLEADFEQAEALYAESAVHAAAADPRGAHLSQSLRGLAKARWTRRDCLGAERALRDSLRIMRDLGDVVGVAECLELFAAIALERGDEHRAGVLGGAADALRASVGEEYTSARTTTPFAVPEDARAAGAQFSLDEAVAYALNRSP